MAEMNDLGTLTGKGALTGLNVIITHVKPPLNNIEKIKQQLKAENTAGLNLIFPQQGKAINL